MIELQFCSQLFINVDSINVKTRKKNSPFILEE
jgi:hypothetical protein